MVKRLVVDASIARSAGAPTALDPTAVDCREFLKELLNHSHCLVLNHELKSEWQKHRSKFSLAWQTSMFARKKIELINTPLDQRLRERIRRANANAKDREAATKDYHLIDAAKKTDQRIASLDETARAIFKNTSSSVEEIRSIIWVNPTKASEAVHDWLSKGAQTDQSRKFG